MTTCEENGKLLLDHEVHCTYNNKKKHYFRVKNKCQLHYILPSKKFGLKLKGNYTNQKGVVILF